MYADDTTLYFDHEDFPALINNELEKGNIWLKLNKITLSVFERSVKYNV